MVTAPIHAIATVFALFAAILLNPIHAHALSLERIDSIVEHFKKYVPEIRDQTLQPNSRTMRPTIWKWDKHVETRLTFVGLEPELYAAHIEFTAKMLAQSSGIKITTSNDKPNFIFVNSALDEARNHSALTHLPDYADLVQTIARPDIKCRTEGYDDGRHIRFVVAILGKALPKSDYLKCISVSLGRGFGLAQHSDEGRPSVMDSRRGYLFTSDDLLALRLLYDSRISSPTTLNAIEPILSDTRYLCALFAGFAEPCSEKLEK